MTVRICPMCETRPVLQRQPTSGRRGRFETLCRPCKNAGTQLQRYWRHVGMPLDWAEHRDRLQLRGMRRVA